MHIGLKTRYCPQNHLDLDWFYTIRSQPNPLDEQQCAVRRPMWPGSGVSTTQGRGLLFFKNNAVFAIGSELGLG